MSTRLISAQKTFLKVMLNQYFETCRDKKFIPMNDLVNKLWDNLEEATVAAAELNHEACLETAEGKYEKL